MTTSTSHPYPALARLSVARHLSGEVPEEAWCARLWPDPGLWSARRGCFVSIKTLAGDLRGCIGTIAATRENLAWEIMANAVSAATRDPRFRPLGPDELDGVKFSVDVLGEPEPVSSLDELDPARFGVIVSKDGRRGLLLPALEGVETVHQQVAIAARKAGLSDLNGLNLMRFEVERFPEGAAVDEP